MYLVENQTQNQEWIEPINQINEDIFHDKRNGKYIEIGAGGEGIATAFFERELGWTGILVEPNPISYEKLVKNRPNNVIYKKVISTYSIVDFHSYYGPSADMSAIEETVPEDIALVYYNDEIIMNEKKTIDEVETKTLTDIIHENFDFMVIDTNGHELEVLKSWDFSFPIEYIIYNHGNLNKTRSNECDTIIKKNQYIFVDTVLIDTISFDVFKKEYNTNDSCCIS